MSAAVFEPKSSKPAEQWVPQTKLVVAYFKESVTLPGLAEMNSAAVSKTGSNCVDEILPGVMDPEGRARIAKGDEQSTGLILRKRIHDLHTNQRRLAQTLVPWSNVKCVGYGSET